MLPEDGSTPEIFSDFTRLLGGMALDGLDRWAFYVACCEPKVRLAISKMCIRDRDEAVLHDDDPVAHRHRLGLVVGCLLYTSRCV